MSIFRTKITLQSTSGTFDFSGFTVGSTPQVLWNPLDSTFDAGQTIRKILLDNGPFNQAISASTLVMTRDGVELSTSEAYQTFNEVNQVWSQVDSAASAFTLLKVNKANGFTDTAKIKLDALADIDGRQIVTNWPVGLGWRTWICGSSDDETPPIEESGRGTGDPVLIEFDGPGTGSMTLSFNEVVQLKNGKVCYEPVANWSARDRTSIGFTIPANSSSIASGTEGNVIPIPQLGGIYNIFVPPWVASSPVGSHVIQTQNMVPIPAPNKDGYWNFDINTGIVSPTVSGTLGDYHLLDIPQSFYFVRNVPMPSSTGYIDIISDKVEPIHPAWYMFMNVTKVTSGSGLVSGWFHSFRRSVQ